MSVIKEDCFWYIDDREPEETRTMKAMCMKCHEIHNFGWFWKGKTVGYGDYDLNCAICGDQIHLRDHLNDEEKETTETTSQNPRR